jgi:hypothetical protein
MMRLPIHSVSNAQRGAEMTRSHSFLRTVLVCLAIVAAASAAFAADHWIGTWKLNVAKSKYSPGPPPKSQTLTFEQTADGITLTTESVDAKGSTVKGGFVSKFDGKDVPWEGNPDADTASPKRINDNRYENTWKKAGKKTVTATVAVSADGKTLTVTQKGTNAQGQPVNTVAVYEKQ